MKAFVFKPSNESIGRFTIGSLDELPAELQRFLANERAVPLFSYVEVSGQSWTIVSRQPFRLQEGIIKGQATSEEEESSAASGDVSSAAFAHASGVQHREFLVWTASWPLFFFLYAISAGHDIWTGYWSASFEDGPMFFVLFILIGSAYAAIQTWFSTSLSTAFVRILALSVLMAVGQWEEFPKAIACGILYFIVALITRWVRSFRRKGQVDQLAPPARHDEKRWVWVGVLVVSLIMAVSLRPILLSEFSTTVRGTAAMFGGEDLRTYRIPPSLISRFVLLSWIGAGIFCISSAFVLFAHNFGGMSSGPVDSSRSTSPPAVPIIADFSRHAGRRYYIRGGTGQSFRGPLTAEEIAQELGSGAMDSTCLATEATGQSTGVLKRMGNDEWIPVSKLLGV